MGTTEAKPSGRKKVLNFSIDPGDHKVLRLMAAEDDTNVADLVRRAVRDLIERERPDAGRRRQAGPRREAAAV